MAMHIEYAADAVIRAEKNGSDRAVLECYADDGVLLKLVDQLGDEKAKSIAETVRAAAKTRFAKVTSKQRWALATAILNKYPTARAAFAAAYNVSEEAFIANAGK